MEPEKISEDMNSRRHMYRVAGVPLARSSSALILFAEIKQCVMNRRVVVKLENCDVHEKNMA